MTVVVIPWRAQASRLAALDAVTCWYLDHLDGADLRFVDSQDQIFNLAQARNIGVASVEDPDEVVVIGDADTLPQRDSLLAAIEGAAGSGMVHLPYDEYRWLRASGTAQFEAGTPLENCEHELVRGPARAST